MPAKKPRPKDEKPQRERFLETAKDLDAEDGKGAFERAFKQVVPVRPPPANGASDKKEPGD